MRAHVDIEKPLTPFKLTEALNAQLRPAPIAIVGCEIVAGDWHARFACVGRAYEYRIVNRRAPLTWDKGMSWQVARALDTDAMHGGGQQLIGLPDFKTVRRTGKRRGGERCVSPVRSAGVPHPSQ